MTAAVARAVLRAASEWTEDGLGTEGVALALEVGRLLRSGDVTTADRTLFGTWARELPGGAIESLGSAAEAMLGVAAALLDEWVAADPAVAAAAQRARGDEVDILGAAAETPAKLDAARLVRARDDAESLLWTLGFVAAQAESDGAWTWERKLRASAKPVDELARSLDVVLGDVLRDVAPSRWFGRIAELEAGIWWLRWVALEQALERGGVAAAVIVPLRGPAQPRARLAAHSAVEAPNDPLVDAPLLTVPRLPAGWSLQAGEVTLGPPPTGTLLGVRVSVISRLADLREAGVVQLLDTVSGEVLEADVGETFAHVWWRAVAEAEVIVDIAGVRVQVSGQRG